MSEQAPGNGQGNPAEPAAPAGAAGALAAPPPTPVAAPIPWLEGADPLTVGYVQNKGWTEPTQVLDGYRNLEKLLGADRAGNTVILPKPDAPQAELDAFYNRLGRPSEPAGYKLQVLGKIGDAKFAELASAKMHELGITQKAGEALGAWWNEYAGTGIKDIEEKRTLATQEQELALKKDWGAAFQQNTVQAQNFVRAMGISDETLNKLEEGMGFKATMEFFQKLGAKMGEAEFVGGDGKEPFGSALTPGQAQAKIAELKTDKNFVARYTSGDAAARAEMKQLHEFAYPEST